MTSILKSRQAPASARRRGFTILELMVSMGIFTILGSMVVVFMRQSLNIFSVGTRESAMYDRMDAVLPRIQSDLEGLFIGDQWDAPRPPPTDEQLIHGAEKPPPRPPTAIRFRAGHVPLQGLTGEMKNFPAPFFSLVVANASEWKDALRRRGGSEISSEAVPLTPKNVEAATKRTVFLPGGGLTEVLWIAIPEDEDMPSILTLYRGEQSPVGDPKTTLLDPAQFDTIAKVKERCRPVARGVLHFGALWRRAFSSGWEPSLVTGRGETDEYVGTRWDSTRGLDPKFNFYRKGSAGDPSDDIFPAFVRLEITLVPAGQFDFSQGDLLLRENIAADARELVISDPDALQAPGLGETRHLKIGTEWMEYEFSDVNHLTRKVRVRRGRRGTKKTAHEARDWIYIGTSNEIVMQLPVFRDRYALRGQK